MKLTSNMLNDILKNMRIIIPESKKKELLEEFSTLVFTEDGGYYEYTEQDIYEQLRKKLRLYENKNKTTGDD